MGLFNMDKMITPIKRAKNFGSAQSGSHHWLAQRISAIILIFLSLWLVFSLAHSGGMGAEYFLEYWHNPYRIGLFNFTIWTAIYHAELGLSIIIGDYIHQVFWRNFLLIFIKILALSMAFFVGWQLLYWY